MSQTSTMSSATPVRMAGVHRMLERRHPLLVALLSAGILCLAAMPSRAQDAVEEEYKPQLPEVAIYKAMLDANKQT
ncbi:MAG: hypothetical protein AAAB14_07185, partial [Ensifer adhaerens]